MFCAACTILAYVFAATIAIALLLIYRSNKMQESIRTCVCKRGVIFDYGLYMCRVACMIVACVAPVKCAIARLPLFKNKNMQESKRMFVF